MFLTHKLCSRLISKAGIPKLSDGTVLFICDMQEKFRNNIHCFDAIAKVTGRLLEASKILGMKTLITEMYPKGLGHTVKDIGDISGIPVFAKTSFTMLTDDVLKWMAKENNSVVERVILCGIEAHVCVQSTALELVEQGKEVHLIVDAVSSRNPIDRKFAFRRMEQSGVYITTSESILLNIMCSSRHPKFREVQKLILEPSPDSCLDVC